MSLTQIYPAAQVEPTGKFSVFTADYTTLVNTALVTILSACPSHYHDYPYAIQLNYGKEYVILLYKDKEMWKRDIEVLAGRDVHGL